MTPEIRAAVVEPPREGRILSADVVKRLRTAMVHRNVLNDLCDSHELLRSALSAAQHEGETLRAERDGIRKTYSQLASEYDRLYASYNAVADAAASRPPSTDGGK